MTWQLMYAKPHLMCNADIFVEELRKFIRRNQANRSSADISIRILLSSIHPITTDGIYSVLSVFVSVEKLKYLGITLTN